jgi:hypothetical protein
MVLEQINGEPPTKELQAAVHNALDEDVVENLY